MSHYLVIVGVRADGTKEFVAIADGYRESTESWAGLLRDLKRRGLRASVLAVGENHPARRSLLHHAGADEHPVRPTTPSGEEQRERK